MIRPANPFLSRVTSTAYSVLASPSSDMPNSMHRPIPAPEPNPEPNPAPDAAWPNDHANITPADWDQLFHAVQARLEDCVSDARLRTPVLALRDQQAETKTAVLVTRDKSGLAGRIMKSFFGNAYIRCNVVY